MLKDDSMKWKIKRAPNVDREFHRDFKAGKISQEDIDVLTAWTEQVEKYGPSSLRKMRHQSDIKNENFLENEESSNNFWNDHDLKDDRAGQRSSSYSRLGRIIYEIKDNEIQIVEILKITPDHKY
jgi:mRNA-degrading endonuclease YafQ of YafQ-DinJ toxin-antitoxin module